MNSAHKTRTPLLLVTLALLVPLLAPSVAGGGEGGADALVRHDVVTRRTTRVRSRDRGESPSARPLPPGAHPLVFPPDDRVEVPETTSLPYSAICKIELTFPSGRRFDASAVMVGPRHAMTAGHVVFDSARGGWADEIVALPGRNGNSRPFRSAVAVELYSTAGWVDEDDVEHDFGLIEFGSDVGNATGWVPYTMAADQEVVGASVRVTGYPADKLGGTHQYEASGTVSGVSAFEMFYAGTLDTFGGQSGSPIWAGTGEDPVILGIHTFGNEETNGGVRITQALFDLVQGVLGSEDFVPETDIADGPGTWKRWNKLPLNPEEAAVYRFSVDDAVLKHGDPVRRLSFKVKPKQARAVVRDPDGGVFTTYPGKGVIVREPSEGEWEVRVFLDDPDRSRKVRVKVKPGKKP